MILKIFKFCLVGGSGMLLDFALTYLLKEKFKVHRYAANGVGFICAATSNFALNRYWTFNNHNPEVYRQYGFFLIFSLIGLGINTFFLVLFEKQKFNFYVSKLFAIALTTIWNFTSNYFFTFNGE
jgi:putative flippase GtrA